jgi:UDP-2-acetamido-3-amino-2,3-dideoxy-glucuronate N-acetyltransferase
MSGYIHPSATVDARAEIGEGTKVWINVQVREGAQIGRDCILSKDVYIDHDVIIGDRCKVQNSVSVYNGVTIEDEVFVGPNACFTNDRVPRAFLPDWQVTPTLIKRGASIGANATIVCGVTVGEYAMIGAGSVVTRDVEPYALMVGNPAKQIGYVDREGNRVEPRP